MATKEHMRYWRAIARLPTGQELASAAVVERIAAFFKIQEYDAVGDASIERWIQRHGATGKNPYGFQRVRTGFYTFSPTAEAKAVIMPSTNLPQFSIADTFKAEDVNGWRILISGGSGWHKTTVATCLIRHMSSYIGFGAVNKDSVKLFCRNATPYKQHYHHLFPRECMTHEAEGLKEFWDDTCAAAGLAQRDEEKVPTLIIIDDPGDWKWAKQSWAQDMFESSRAERVTVIVILQRLTATLPPAQRTQCQCKIFVGGWEEPADEETAWKHMRKYENLRAVTHKDNLKTFFQNLHELHTVVVLREAKAMQFPLPPIVQAAAAAAAGGGGGGGGRASAAAASPGGGGGGARARRSGYEGGGSAGCSFLTTGEEDQPPIECGCDGCKCIRAGVPLSLLSEEAKAELRKDDAPGRLW